MEAEAFDKKIENLGIPDAKKNIHAYLKTSNDVIDSILRDQNILRGLGDKDPYFLISKELERAEEKQNVMNQVNEQLRSLNPIWGSIYVVALGINSVRSLDVPHPSLDMQTFFNRIENSMQPGRLLISLPGERYYNGQLLTYFKPTKRIDPGHVAVISKDRWTARRELREALQSEKANNIDGFSLSIGTDSKKGMREESFLDDWAKIHGDTYVVQIYDVSYRRVGKWWQVWKWERVKTEVDNNVILTKANERLGTPYCNVAQILTARWAAPGRLICSSAAWWYAKSGVNVDMGDWWKPMILPHHILFSDKTEIVGQTF